MKSLAACGLLVLLALPASGQATDLQQMLSGKAAAPAMKLKDLNGDWQHVAIGSIDKPKSGNNDMLSLLMQIGAMGDKNKKKDDAATTALGMSFLSSMFGGSGDGGKEPVYYTKGQTVTLGTETFLIGYHYQKPAVDLMKLIADSEKNGGKDPDFTKMMGDSKMTPDSPLTFTLLNVRTIGTLTDIRPFDINKEIAESAAGGGLMDIIAQAANDKSKNAPANVDLSANHASTLAPAVKAALLRDPQLASGRNAIVVDFDEANALTLKGHVSSEALKQRAGSIAKKTVAEKEMDTVNVRNNLTVRAIGGK